MGLVHTVPILLILGLLTSFTYATNFKVVNKCSYTVWAAASPGGGKRLDPGKSWSFDVPAGTTGGRVWGRTNCHFDDSGRGKCATGDCNGLLVCEGYGSPPNTLAGFELDQPYNLDYYYISNVKGYNIPMDFRPTNGKCKDIRCKGVLEHCPSQLKVKGGCNNPCTVYKTNEYCCTNGPCGPTHLSKYFKGKCPDAYSYPQDDKTSLFTCTSGTNYKVTFCP